MVKLWKWGQQLSPSVPTSYIPPSKVTHLVQPCDRFLFQMIKRAWATHWKSYNPEMTKASKWKESSGQPFNTGKTFFLRLTARCVREMNQKTDGNGIYYGWKSTIITGMEFNTNGQWKVNQITPGWPRIVSNHHVVFDTARGAAVLPQN